MGKNKECITRSSPSPQSHTKQINKRCLQAEKYFLEKRENPEKD